MPYAILFAALVALAGCGELPRPFAHAPGESTIPPPPLLDRAAADRAPEAEDRRAPLFVAAIAGAPGDGRQALRQAMARALERAGAPLAPGLDRAGLVLLGSVSVAPPQAGAQAVEVLWEVITPEGRRLGVVRQANAVPAGALDGAWGPLADTIAQAAAGGVLDLLARTAWR